MIIRDATINDTERLLNIYAYYVKNTAISFEYKVPSVEEFQSRIVNTLKKYPYLVIEEDGEIKGYAYAGAFHPRAAYSHCCELSIYLDYQEKHHGYGRALYEELEKRLREMGILNLYACIGYPIEEDEYLTHDSYNFHTRVGYTKVAHLKGVGKKYDRWYDLIWMQKIINE